MRLSLFEPSCSCLWPSYTGLRTTEYSCFWSHFSCVRSIHIRIFIIILYHRNILCLKKLSFELILIMHIFYMSHVIYFINILLSPWKKFTLNLHISIIWMSWSSFLNSILYYASREKKFEISFFTIKCINNAGISL